MTFWHSEIGEIWEVGNNFIDIDIFYNGRMQMIKQD